MSALAHGFERSRQGVESDGIGNHGPRVEVASIEHARDVLEFRKTLGHRKLQLHFLPDRDRR